jgi:hypothetical protein
VTGTLIGYQTTRPADNSDRDKSARKRGLVGPEAALEFMKQNKSNDLEVSDLPTEDVKVDGIPQHVYYTAKAIRSFLLS